MKDIELNPRSQKLKELPTNQKQRESQMVMILVNSKKRQLKQIISLAS
ncbi:46504_t:CDS:2 [Gigaspora margarita]|uniref:46504_t:CDS:1 n=1 Tax=Gigaspora margarita TaxID=4874 RepID=A0ABM8VYT3_GIGMA|nr:46504_t:CDS:2 [Gigaspora margarita]